MQYISQKIRKEKIFPNSFYKAINTKSRQQQYQKKKRNLEPNIWVSIDAKILNKTLAIEFINMEKELYTMTKWTLFQGSKPNMKNQLMQSTILAG